MALNKEQTIRGTAYSWSQIKINIGGNVISEVKAISYKTKQAKQNNYGAGSGALSRSRGKKEYEGSIQLFMTAMESLRKNAKSGDLTDIAPFTIVVSYLPEGGTIVTHTLKYCEFLEDGYDVKEGDMEVAPTLPIIIGGVDYGI